MLEIIKFLFLLLLVCGFNVIYVQAQETPTETLTLEQAIDLALEENIAVKNTEIDKEKIKLAQAAYRTRKYPAFKTSAFISQPLTRMTFTIEKGQFGNYPSTGPIPDTTTRISSSMTPNALIQAQIQQPLTQLYAINLNVKKYDINKEITQEQIRQKRQATTADVKTAYFQVMQTESLLKNAEETVKLSREINRITEEYVKAGVALVPEQMETGTKVSQAEYDVMTLKNRSATQKEQLNYVLGRDVRTDFNVVFPENYLSVNETDLSIAQQRALDQRPEIRQAKLKIKQSNLDVKIKKSEYIPDVSLTVSYVSPFSYSNFLPKNIMSAGVSIEWEVFDWGRKKKEMVEKQLAVNQSENSLLEAENMVLMEVNAKFRKLREAAENLRIMQMSQKTTQANLKIALNRYEQQTILYKELLQVQTTLTQANTNYQNALLSFWTAKAEFEKAIGEEK